MTTKNRLKEIKKRVKKATESDGGDREAVGEILFQDVPWLIQRVRELEATLKHIAQHGGHSHWTQRWIDPVMGKGTCEKWWAMEEFPLEPEDS